MNAAWLIIVAIFTLWALGATAIAIADAAAERRYRNSLQTRDWLEKVEAMRRMQDREGDA